MNFNKILTKSDKILTIHVKKHQIHVKNNQEFHFLKITKKNVKNHPEKKSNVKNQPGFWVLGYIGGEIGVLGGN